MKANPYDALFRDVAADRRAEPNRARDLRRCDECSVYSAQVLPWTDGRLRCEPCRMANVNAAMRAAATVPASNLRTQNSDSLLKEPAHV